MTLMLKEIFEQPTVIKAAIDGNYDLAKKLCVEIEKRKIKYVYLAGRGTSDHAGIYFKYILETYTHLPVALAAPSILTMYDGKVDFTDGLVVGISQSGEAADVLEVIKRANKQNALTMSITNFEKSPLASESNYHFCCNAGLEKSVAATKTFTAEMVICALITALLSKEDDLLKQVLSISDLIKNYLENYSIDKKAVKLLKDKKECFVLARGMNYPISLEATLKIQETCYVRARGYSISDFYHGPLAMLEKDMPVILIAPEGASTKDIKEIVMRLKDNDCSIISFTNIDSIKEDSSGIIDLPSGLNDFISPFISAVAIQRYACDLSLLKGLNPDNPRNLKKVTITK